MSFVLVLFLSATLSSVPGFVFAYVVKTYKTDLSHNAKVGKCHIMTNEDQPRP